MNPSDPELLVQQNVGAKIRTLRKASGLTAVELAARADISQSQLSKIETGKANLSIKTLEQLCRVLERPLSYLFQSDREMPRVLGTLNTVAGPESQGVEWFAEEVRRRTDQRISLIPLRPSQLGPPADQVEQLRQGVIDVFIEELAHFQKYVPELNVFSLPYAFQDDAHLQAFLNSSYFLDNLCARLVESGFRLLNRRWNWRRGLEWVLLSTRPIFTPDQVRGLRVRVNESPLLAHFWEAMGAEPVVVTWSAVKDALRRGRVDVVPTHKAHLYPLGFCRYARYVTLLGDVRPVLAVAINEVKYKVLHPDIQNALLDACDAAGDYFSNLVASSEEKNEVLNLSTYKTAYLKVDQEPWRQEAARIHQLLSACGELPAGLEREVQGASAQLSRQMDSHH